MNVMQKAAYASVALVTASSEMASAAINFGTDQVQSGVKGTDATADSAVQRLVGNFMFFLGILAVLYGLYGGFLILSSGGDEEKVKKGKTILMHVGLGLIVIFLANSIVQWIIGKILI